MTRSPNNPILSAKDIPYPASLVFNAGVCKWQGRYVMLFRNDHGIDEGEYKAARARGEAKGFSTNIGIATSADGVHWEVGPKPVFQMRDDEILRVNWMGTPRNARFTGLSAISTHRMTSELGRSPAKRLFLGGR